jgi:hypothetical protein
LVEQKVYEQMGCALRFASWALVALALASVPAKAAGTSPVLTLTPAEMSLRSLSEAETAQAEVTLQATDLELNDVVLTTFSNDGVSAALLEGDMNIAKLAPHEAHAWRLRIARVRGALLPPAKLYVRVAYDTAVNGTLKGLSISAL